MTLTDPSPFSQVLSTLLRRRWTILLTAMFGTAAVFAVAMVLPLRYTAKAQLVVKSQQPSLLAGQQAVITQSPDEPTVLTEITAITSYDQLRRVLDSLRNDPQFGHIVAARAKPHDEQDLLPQLQTWVERLLSAQNNSWLTIRELQRNLKVFQEAGSHVIGVSFVSGQAVDSAAIVNRIVKLYVEHQQEAKRAATDRALAWVDGRLKTLQKDSAATEASLRAYQSSRQLIDTSHAGAMDQRLADLSRELATAEADAAARSERVKNIEDLRHNGATAESLAGAFNSPSITELRRRAWDLMQARIKLATTYHKDDPSIDLVDRQLQEVRRLMGVEVSSGIQGLISDASVSAARVASLRSRLDLLQASSSDSSVRTLERQDALNHALYLSLAQREEELHQQREGLSPNIDILSLAAPPDRPTSPGPILFVPPALIAFTILGCFIAVLREGLDHTLRGESEITAALGLRCAGLVPRVRPPNQMRLHEYLLSHPFSHYAEAIRSLVAATHLRPAEQANKVILVTSSLPGEGKTTLAVSLATYTAKLGYRVLLVDLDLRKPGILRALGGRDQDVSPMPLRQGPLSEASVQHLPGLNLDYLPVRRDRSLDPVALFARADIANSLGRLRDRYDCIVIDSAPLLAITEARLLAAMADRILFVVKSGSTRHEEACGAIDMLRNGGFLKRDSAALASVVINQIDPKSHASYRYKYDYADAEFTPDRSARSAFPQIGGSP
ncbi:GumC family protein [Rhodopila sp.]|uniref:GumC family protein n=1 Tax=Rhodopila sp. TaxID=2480087 RepID=UPI003D113FFD